MPYSDYVTPEQLEAIRNTLENYAVDYTYNTESNITSSNSYFENDWVNDWVCASDNTKETKEEGEMEKFWELYNGEEIRVGDKIILENSQNLVETGTFSEDMASYFGGAVAEILDDFCNWGQQRFYIKIIEGGELNTPEERRYFRQVTSDCCNRYCVNTDNINSLYYEGYIPPTNPKVRCCAFCGRFYTITPEDKNTLPEEDIRLCETCRKRNAVLPYHQYKPELLFYKEENEVLDFADKDLYLGIELEVDEGGESNSTVRNIMPIMNKEDGKFFIYCGHDSSLSRGFEIITNPATPNYHRFMEKDYAKLFKELVNRGYFSHNTSTCGIHVHFNRNYFADKEELCTARLLYLIEKFWEDIIIFSRRNKRRLNYCKKIDISIPKYIKQWDKTNEHGGHYFALNLVNENTIEFRIFRGTLNINTFMCIIDFMENLIKTAKTKTINKIQKMEFDELLTDRAREYFLSRKALQNFEE